MDRLLRFFYEYRAFFTFLVLELVCAWLIVQNNQYQSASYFNSSNRLAANIVGFSNGVREYFSLRDINNELADENAELRTKLEKRNQSFYSLETHEIKDPAIINRFDYVSAKVVNTTSSFFKNYITINKGSDDGIRPGMAAISSVGAVGKVKSVSEHYSVLISLLNVDEQVSSVIKRTENFGTVQWDGVDARFANFLYIPRHVTPQVGDTIVTSGFNAVFPEGVFVGIIRDVRLSEEAAFHNIRIELAQDFTKLSFVEIVRSNLKSEKDSLELKTIGEPK
ncbi:MAG: rod shape-determining protein MreC [Bacteroidia bacterium]|nr:rod shape-determining protein MreC [Bacteroidia bacterium]